MHYDLHVTTFDPDAAGAGLQVTQQIVASRDIKKLQLPATTVSFHFPLPDNVLAPVYYIGRPLTFQETVRRTLPDQATSIDIVNAERQIKTMFKQNVCVATAETTVYGRMVYLRPDDCVLNNVTDKRTVWRHNPP